MRRATSAARNLAGLDTRDRDGIPTLSWPPEPSDTAAGMNNIFYCTLVFPGSR